MKAEDINTATNSNPLPLYIQLSDQLRKKIVNHEIKKGEKIPSEMQLHESTGMSRSTVRKAIEILVEENLLIKVHGKGTFVSNEKIIEDKNSQFLSFTENARRLGKKLITKTVNSQLVIPTKEQSNFFDIDSTEKIIEIIRLRYMDNIPICVETSWFTNSFEFLMNEDLDGSLYELLINKYDVMPAKGKKTFEICYSNQNESFLLDVPRGSALMLIEDYVYDSYNKPLHLTKQVLRGDKFKFAVIQ